MKLLIKILLFVFLILIANIKVVSAATTFPDYQQTATSFSFHNEISKIAFKVIENDLAHTCQSGRNLLDYRNLAISSGANAAKG